MAEERKQSDRIRLWLWRGLGVLLVIVFFTTRFLTRERLQVRAAEVGHEVLVNTVSTNGRVEPVVAYEFHSPLESTVRAVYVQPGDVVPAGKLLLTLDDHQALARLASAESGVKAAEAQLEAATHNGTQQERQTSAGDIERSRLDRDQAQRDLAALTRLQSTGAASASEVAAARQRLDSAEASLHASQQGASNRYSPAEVARAQAALAEAEAGLAAARHVEEQTIIRAPVAGTVYKLEAEATEFAEEGKLLLEMADLNHERVRAYFDEPEIGRLQVGQKILIKWDGDANPLRAWHGHIVRIPVTVITYGTRTVGEVLVQIDDPDAGLLPDTNVTVTTSSEPNALSVPREALHSENGKGYVFKIDGNELVRTPVVTGTINLTQVSILSGLNEGDSVALGTTNGVQLKAGVPVKVVH